MAQFSTAGYGRPLDFSGLAGALQGWKQRRAEEIKKQKIAQIMKRNVDPKTGQPDFKKAFTEVYSVDPGTAMKFREMGMKQQEINQRMAETPASDLKIAKDNLEKENIWLSKIEGSPNPQMVYEQMRGDMLKYNPERAKALPAYSPEVVRKMRIGRMNTNQLISMEQSKATKSDVVPKEQALKAIPGFTPIDGVDITKDSVKAVKKAAGDFEGLKKQIARVKELYKKSGIKLTGPEAARMRVAVRTIQLQAKEGLFNLGVLNGADLSILEGVVPNPTDIRAGLRKGVEGETIIPQLEELEAYIDLRSSEGYKVHGFTKDKPSALPTFKTEAEANASGVKGEVLINGRRAVID